MLVNAVHCVVNPWCAWAAKVRLLGLSVGVSVTATCIYSGTRPQKCNTNGNSAIYVGLDLKGDILLKVVA